MIRFGVAIVRGRSMEPTYVDGDRLLVAYGARVAPGRAHVIRLPDGPHGPRPIAVKRLAHEVPDGWWAVRDNPDEGVDSRTVGPIPNSEILARVICRLPRLG